MAQALCRSRRPHPRWMFVIQTLSLALLFCKDSLFVSGTTTTTTLSKQSSSSSNAIITNDLPPSTVSPVPMQQKQKVNSQLHQVGQKQQKKDEAWSELKRSLLLLEPNRKQSPRRQQRQRQRMVAQAKQSQPPQQRRTPTHGVGSARARAPTQRPTTTRVTQTTTCSKTMTYTNALLDALRNNIREAQTCASLASTLASHITNTSLPALQDLVQSFSTPQAVSSAVRAQKLLDAVQSQLLSPGTTLLQALPEPIHSLLENLLTHGMIDLTLYLLTVDEAVTDTATYQTIVAAWNTTLAQLKVISTTATKMITYPNNTLSVLQQAIKQVEQENCKTRDVTALETASQAYLTEYQDILMNAFEPCNTALEQSPVILQAVPSLPDNKNDSDSTSTLDEMFSEVTLYFQDLVEWVTNYTNSVVAAIQQAQGDGSIHCCLSMNQLDYAAMASTALSDFETIKSCFLEGPIDLTTAADVIPLFDNAQTWLDIVSATISNINAVSQSIRSAVAWSSSNSHVALLPDYAKSYPTARFNRMQSPYFTYTRGIPLVSDTTAVLNVTVPPFAAATLSYTTTTTSTLAKDSAAVVYTTCVQGATVYDSGAYQNYWEQESFDCCSTTGICSAKDPITLYDGLGCSGNFVGTLSLPVAPATNISVDVKNSTCVRPTTKSIQFRGPLAPGFLLEVHSAIPPPCGSNYLAFKLLRSLNSGESFCLATLEETVTTLLYATVYLPFADNSSNDIHLNGNATDFSVTVNPDTDSITTVCLSSNEKTLPPIPVDSYREALTYGDPHLITFGGLSYSCQATGEFILTKSLDSFLQVQVRYAKVAEALSVGRAVVVKDSAEESPVVQISQPGDATASAGGEDVVSFTYNGCPLQLYVNGVLRTNPKFLGAANVTVSAMSQDSLRILYPSSLAVIVRVSNIENNGTSTCFLSSQIELPLAAIRRERLYGLSGIPTATTPTDWTDRSGQLLPVPDPPDTFFEAGYKYCVDNWCLHNSSDSLFVYSSGKSFESYFGCDIPYTAVDITAAASDATKAICGDNIACLVDGSELGVQGAVSAIQQESIIHAASAREFQCTLCSTGTFIAGTTILPGTNLTCNQASDQALLALTASECQTLVDQAASSCCFVPAHSSGGGVPQSQSPTFLPSASMSPSAILPGINKSPSASSSVFPSRRPSVSSPIYPSKSPSSFPSRSPLENKYDPSDIPSDVPSRMPKMQSDVPSSVPSYVPNRLPSIPPSPRQSDMPSSVPWKVPSDVSSRLPTVAPSPKQSDSPSSVPWNVQSNVPSRLPTVAPSPKQSDSPSSVPSNVPSYARTRLPTPRSAEQSNFPSSVPSDVPSQLPTIAPSPKQSDVPSSIPSDVPSLLPTVALPPKQSDMPSSVPSEVPSDVPSQLPTIAPFPIQSDIPSSVPSEVPSDVPSQLPTIAPLP